MRSSRKYDLDYAPHFGVYDYDLERTYKALDNYVDSIAEGKTAKAKLDLARNFHTDIQKTTGPLKRQMGLFKVLQTGGLDLFVPGNLAQLSFDPEWVQLCIDYAHDWYKICEEDVQLEASDKKFAEEFPAHVVKAKKTRKMTIKQYESYFIEKKPRRSAKAAAT